MRRVGRGRATGQEDIDLDEFVNGTNLVQQPGNHDAGNLRLSRYVLDVGSVEDRRGADGIAHGGHVTRHGAVAHGHQKPGVGANLSNLLLVVDRGNGSLDQRDIDFVGKYLGVDDGAVNDVDKLGQLDEPFIHVEKRHVAARASVEPDRGQFQLAHRASLIWFRLTRKSGYLG